MPYILLEFKFVDKATIQAFLDKEMDVRFLILSSIYRGRTLHSFLPQPTSYRKLYFADYGKRQTFWMANIHPGPDVLLYYTPLKCMLDDEAIDLQLGCNERKKRLAGGAQWKCQ